MDYGKKLKEQRELFGYSQNALAKATGINQQTISWWENNKGIPSIDFCVQLAQFYGCTLDELVGMDNYNAISKNKALSEQKQKTISAFDSEFNEILSDNSFIQTAKLYKAITPELRALALGYIVGLLQNNNVNTRTILGY